MLPAMAQEIPLMDYGFNETKRACVFVYIDEKDTFQQRQAKWKALFENPRWKPGMDVAILLSTHYNPPANIGDHAESLKMISNAGARKAAVLVNEAIGQHTAEQGAHITKMIGLEAARFTDLQSMFDWLAE